MVRETRLPEGQEVDRRTIKLFSRVAALTAIGAAMRVRAILGKKINPGALILDIGTGPATIPLQLKRFFPQALFTGLDVSLNMLAEARRHNRGKAINLVAGDGTRLPFGDHTLDGVVSFFTMHHIDEPAGLLREINRVLKPEGFLLVIDFRRDMSRLLFRLMNTAWQAAFLLSSGRKGFQESVESAWRPDEIAGLLEQENIDRFAIHQTRTELILH